MGAKSRANSLKVLKRVAKSRVMLFYDSYRAEGFFLEEFIAYDHRRILIIIEKNISKTRR
jgi:hypothetical protein